MGADESEPFFCALKYARDPARAGFSRLSSRLDAHHQVIRPVLQLSVMHQAFDRPLHIGDMLFGHLQLLGNGPGFHGPIFHLGNKIQNRPFQFGFVHYLLSKNIYMSKVMNVVKPTGCNPWAWIGFQLVPTLRRGNVFHTMFKLN